MNSEEEELFLKGRKRTEDVVIADGSEHSFSDLLLSENILRGLQSAGYERPSPVQLQAIPLGRFGLDIVAQAKSGTGKTVVFSVVALDSVDLDNPKTQVMIVAPTREVANQIQEVIQKIGKFLENLKCECFIGGTSTFADRKKAQGCQIVVGTPGRLQALIEDGSLQTQAIRVVIVDEADKLLDDKFRAQLTKLITSLPDRKQMLAFSATFEEPLLDEIQRFMRNPKVVDLCVGEVKLKGVSLFYCRTQSTQNMFGKTMKKSEVLLDLLGKVSFNQCLVFCNDLSRGNRLVDCLKQDGWPSAFLSGGHTQQERKKAMTSFQDLNLRILVCSDLIARGVDLERVNLVVNVDLPRDAETFMHRVGRTGRFGTFGVAISLVNTSEFKILKKFQSQYNLVLNDLPSEIPSDLYEFGVPASNKKKKKGVKEKKKSSSPSLALSSVPSPPLSSATLEPSSSSLSPVRPLSSLLSEETDVDVQYNPFEQSPISSKKRKRGPPEVDSLPAKKVIVLPQTDTSNKDVSSSLLSSLNTEEEEEGNLDKDKELRGISDNWKEWQQQQETETEDQKQYAQQWQSWYDWCLWQQWQASWWYQDPYVSGISPNYDQEFYYYLQNHYSQLNWQLVHQQQWYPADSNSSTTVSPEFSFPNESLSAMKQMMQGAFSFD